MHIALIISLTLLHHFFHINSKRINLTLISGRSNHQVIPIVIRVRYGIKVSILIKILRINRRSILLKLVTPHHWAIFNIAIFCCLYLLFWWLHSDTHICAVCHQELLSFLVLVLKVRFLFVGEGGLEQDVLWDAVEVWAYCLVFGHVRALRVFLGVSSGS